MERETLLALPRVVVQLEATAATWQVVEVAGFLCLADDPLGDRLPGGADTDPTVGITPDGGSSRFVPTDQWVGAGDGRSCRSWPQMGQWSVPASSRDI